MADRPEPITVEFNVLDADDAATLSMKFGRVAEHLQQYLPRPSGELSL